MSAILDDILLKRTKFNVGNLETGTIPEAVETRALEQTPEAALNEMERHESKHLVYDENMSLKSMNE